MLVYALSTRVGRKIDLLKKESSRWSYNSAELEKAREKSRLRSQINRVKQLEKQRYMSDSEGAEEGEFLPIDFVDDY